MLWGKVAGLLPGLLLIAACEAGTGDSTLPTTPSTVMPTTTQAAETTTTVSPATSTTTTTVSPATSTTLVGNRIVPVYFFHDSGRDESRPGPFLVTAGRNVLDLEEAVWGVLNGLTPSEEDQGVTTAMPTGVRTYFVRVTDKVAALDLTARFVDGADAPAIRARLAQLVFTVTGFDPVVSGVTVFVEGSPLEALPDGTPLNERLTRSDFEDFLPAILIESPTWDGWSGPPVTVRGVALAPFQMEILGANGQILASRAVPIGTINGWGSFEATFDVSELPSPSPAKSLSIRVYEIAGDGSRTNERVQPLSLRTQP